MTHHAPSPSAIPDGDPGRQVASLREVLRLVRGLAGDVTDEGAEALLDEAATISSRYDRASPVARRRFDGQASELAAWAAAGVEALLASGEAPRPMAARRLAERLDYGLVQLNRSLPQG